MTRIDLDSPLLTALADGLIQVDATDRITFCTGRLGLGALPAETLHGQALDAIPLAPHHIEALRIAVDRTRETSVVERLEFISSRGGETRWLDLRVVADEDARVLIAGRDVTEQRRADEQVQRANRLSAVGVLSAGVAHEINNPLTFISGNLGFLLDHLHRAQRTGEPLDLNELRNATYDAVDGTRRMREIVNNLRTFARPESRTFEVVDVQSVLDAALRMTRNELVHRVTLEEQRHACPAVFGNPSRLAQVAVNLLVNALQAMPDRAARHNRITVRTFERDGAAVLEVEDNGRGIEPDDLSRVFEPFFTTKVAGGGTGLGLAVCHGIVTELGGHMEVESEAGLWTCFRVVVPGHDGTVAPRPQRISGVVHSPPPRAGRILIVDDEPLVLTSLRRVLGRFHEVVTFTDARDALAHFDQTASRLEDFDLLLCDVMMPNMSGDELYDAFVERDAGVEKRFALMTGGTFTERASAACRRLDLPVFEKPIDFLALERFIAERLDDRART